jgi:hypothetical protein
VRDRPTLITSPAMADPNVWAGKGGGHRQRFDGLPIKPTDRYIPGAPGTVPAD